MEKSTSLSKISIFDDLFEEFDLTIFEDRIIVFCSDFLKKLLNIDRLSKEQLIDMIIVFDFLYSSLKTKIDWGKIIGIEDHHDEIFKSIDNSRIILINKIDIYTGRGINNNDKLVDIINTNTDYRGNKFMEILSRIFPSGRYRLINNHFGGGKMLVPVKMSCFKSEICLKIEIVGNNIYKLFIVERCSDNKEYEIISAKGLTNEINFDSGLNNLIENYSNGDIRRKYILDGNDSMRLDIMLRDPQNRKNILSKLKEHTGKIFLHTLVTNNPNGVFD